MSVKTVLIRSNFVFVPLPSVTPSPQPLSFSSCGLNSLTGNEYGFGPKSGLNPISQTVNLLGVTAVLGMEWTFHFGSTNPQAPVPQ